MARNVIEVPPTHPADLAEEIDPMVLPTVAPLAEIEPPSVRLHVTLARLFVTVIAPAAVIPPPGEIVVDAADALLASAAAATNDNAIALNTIRFILVSP